MTAHRIGLKPATAYRTESYGVTHESTYVYQTSRGSYPTRIVVWSNVNRPNPRDGEPVRYGDYGPRDGGNGQYLDPENHATDAPLSVLLSPECVSIAAQRNGTGHPDSGQVYAPAADKIRPGDTLTLVYPDGAEETYAAVFTNNGHGYAAPAE